MRSVDGKGASVVLSTDRGSVSMRKSGAREE
jgi:hypothetical protein